MLNLDVAEVEISGRSLMRTRGSFHKAILATIDHGYLRLIVQIIIAPTYDDSGTIPRTRGLQCY